MTIKDFGEHIPGARKEHARLGLKAAMDADPNFLLPLSKSWPVPRWTDLAAEHQAEDVAAMDLAVVRALRDELRTTSGKAFERRSARPGKLSGLGLRELALGVLDGRWTGEQALNALQERSKPTARTCAHGATLYSVIGHDWDLGYYEAYSYAGGTRWSVYSRRRKDTGHATGGTLREVAAELGRQLGQRTETGQNDEPDRKEDPFHARSRTIDGRKVYGVWRQGPRGLVCVRERETLEEILKALREEHDELEAWWQRWRKLPATRRATNKPRTPAGRDGVDDPDRFTSRFRFRGVQFGNWVEATRRRSDLLDASQALTDLALVLGWDPETLSLGGRVALAFGARGLGGQSGVRAHYETDQKVIAISKTTGPGTLAHEWFHALDHNTAVCSGGASRDFATEASRTGNDDALNRLAQRLRTFGMATEYSPLRRRCHALDRRRPKAKAYWATIREMTARAFEAWVVRELGRHGIRNDYLVNVREPEAWEGSSQMDQGYPYPLEDELDALAPHLERVRTAGQEANGWWRREQETGQDVRRQPAA